jgi:hypothetical protein
MPVSLGMSVPGIPAGTGQGWCRFSPPALDRLWVAEYTYVPAWSGMVYVAFAINNRPRKILDWKTPAEAFEEQLRSLQQPGVATTG